MKIIALISTLIVLASPLTFAGPAGKLYCAGEPAKFKSANETMRFDGTDYDEENPKRGLSAVMERYRLVDADGNSTCLSFFVRAKDKACFFKSGRRCQ